MRDIVDEHGMPGGQHRRYKRQFFKIVEYKIYSPSCGKARFLLKSIGQKSIAVAISANRDFYDHFESAGDKLQKNGSSSNLQ
jgi:hypothetical protein